MICKVRENYHLKNGIKHQPIVAASCGIGISFPCNVRLRIRTPPNASFSARVPGSFQLQAFGASCCLDHRNTAPKVSLAHGVNEVQSNTSSDLVYRQFSRFISSFCPSSNGSSPSLLYFPSGPSLSDPACC